jgi:hypothetical protein
MSKHPKSRSAVTNGQRTFLHPVDGRKAEARRFEDILLEVQAQHGGDACMNVYQKSAARAYASLCVARETMELAQARGEPFDQDQYGVLCDRMDRQARRLGEKRIPALRSARERAAQSRSHQ